MVTYTLDHLTQPDDQCVLGPIQDDEALFLFAMIRGMRMRRILEIGGLSGYSGENFIRAVGEHGVVYTVDMNPLEARAPNHKVIIKDARHMTYDDVDAEPLDLVFFDCHDIVQLHIFCQLRNVGAITDRTVLALHDTNLHYAPYQAPWSVYVPEKDGYAHQPVERHMANEFKKVGYNVFHLHTTKDAHSDAFPFRHGITICQFSLPL